ncbi:MAG: amidohydrolase family protein, partial [Candidatus Xenobia bacterium]
AYVRRLSVDSLVHDPAVLRFLIDLFGADRIALGSDYPFPLGEPVPGTLIESLELDPTTREQLLWRTAAEFLKLRLDATRPWQQDRRQSVGGPH